MERTQREDVSDITASPSKAALRTIDALTLHLWTSSRQHTPFQPPAPMLQWAVLTLLFPSASEDNLLSPLLVRMRACARTHKSNSVCLCARVVMPTQRSEDDFQESISLPLPLRISTESGCCVFVANIFTQ